MKQVATVDNRPPMVVLRERLQAREAEIRAATEIPAETFIRAVMTSVQLNQEILACTFPSVWNACMRACRDGLLPDGIDGAIVPFKGTAQWMPMIQGQLRRFRRSGQFKWVTAGIVYQGEEFTHFIDENGEHFRHVPGSDFNAEILKCYAIATTIDGGVFVAVLNKAEVDKIRGKSRATHEDSPWRQWYTEMAKKTALRRLVKYLPQARDLMSDDDAPIPELQASSSVASIPVHPAIDEAADGDDEQEKSGTPTAAVPEPAVAADPIAVAYNLGKEANARGMKRRAIPGEYRDSSRTREALAWQAGFDGGAMPTFVESQHDEQNGSVDDDRRE